MDSQADPFAIYKRLRVLNPSPYGAYLNFGDYQILSSSPERMFKKVGKCITTSPIKGTIERGKNTIEERENLHRLLHSEKDRAELLMIVDLERNDLGKIAQIGTVHVDSIFKPETYSSLIHLVGDVSSELSPEVGLTDIFKALLPGGSITGAPKRRAVEIINQLEATPRSIYTGCIGYVFGEEAEFNIAIRTMVHYGNTYQVHAGGGIVADSEPEAEYQEMLLKAGNLFKALGVDPKRLAH
ncbi:MAG: anthranilate synthase component I family protein [Candidatus Zixiibacteriota bacterium]